MNEAEIMTPQNERNDQGDLRMNVLDVLKTCQAFASSDFFSRC
jgi:hypothetical protein